MASKRTKTLSHRLEKSPIKERDAVRKWASAPPVRPRLSPLAIPPVTVQNYAARIQFRVPPVTDQNYAACIQFRVPPPLEISWDEATGMDIDV